MPGWTRAVLVKRDTSHGFTSADIGFLEGHLAAELDGAPGIVLVQGKVDEDLTLPPAATVPLNALVSSIFAVLRLAGVSLHRTDIETPTASATTLARPFMVPWRTSSQRIYCSPAPTFTARATGKPDTVT